MTYTQCMHLCYGAIDKWAEYWGVATGCWMPCCFGGPDSWAIGLMDARDEPWHLWTIEDVGEFVSHARPLPLGPAPQNQESQEGKEVTPLAPNMAPEDSP